MSTFWKGWLACASFISLWQDFRGQEAVIASARDNWTSGWITVPFAIAILAVVLWPEKKSADAGGSSV